MTNGPIVWLGSAGCWAVLNPLSYSSLEYELRYPMVVGGEVWERKGLFTMWNYCWLLLVFAPGDQKNKFSQCQTPRSVWSCMLMAQAGCNKLSRTGLFQVVVDSEGKWHFHSLLIILSWRTFRHSRGIYNYTFRKTNLSERVSSVMSGDI